MAGAIELMNSSINQSTEVLQNVTLSGKEAIIQYMKGDFLPRFLDIISAPINDPEMLWIVAPLVTAMMLMEFYFGHYKEEELGWNTAVGNSLVLIFVSLDLLRKLNSDMGINITQMINNPTELPLKIIIASSMGMFGLINMFSNFFHILPKKLAFKISGSLFVNLLAYLAIIIIYVDIPFDLTTMLAAFALFIALVIFFAIVHLIEPKAKDIFSDFKKKYSQLNDPDSLAAKEIREDPFERNFEDHGDYDYIGDRHNHKP